MRGRASAFAIGKEDQLSPGFDSGKQACFIPSGGGRRPLVPPISFGASGRAYVGKSAFKKTRQRRVQAVEKGPFALSAMAAKGKHICLHTLIPVSRIVSSQRNLLERPPFCPQTLFVGNRNPPLAGEGVTITCFSSRHPHYPQRLPGYWHDLQCAPNY